MKKIRFGPVVIFTLFVALFTTMAFAEAPAPFSRAKEYAMFVPADADGDHVWEFTRNNDGEEIRYALVYLTKQRTILIAREPFVCAYVEDTQEVKAVIFMGYGFMPIDKPPEEILEFTFAIFRELVEANALPVLI